MDFSALPIAALPLPAPAIADAQAATPPDKRVPLAQRLTLNPTITAKVNYFDLAQTRRAPFDLRTALIWLCLCAHDNSVWWEPRAPEHQDGEDPPPLPLALNFAAWMRYIQDWQCQKFAVHEDQEIEALALRVWIAAHETVCVPEEDSKKTGQHTTPLDRVLRPRSQRGRLRPARLRPLQDAPACRSLPTARLAFRQRSALPQPRRVRAPRRRNRRLLDKALS